MDLNHRPAAYQTVALPDRATPAHFSQIVLKPTPFTSQILFQPIFALHPDKNSKTVPIPTYSAPMVSFHVDAAGFEPA
jgi:hypothetical protein